MDTPHHDKVFIVTFLGVLGFLVAFTLAIIGIANLLDEGAPPESARDQIAARIQPVAQVVTDASALVKVSAAPVAARAPMSGAEVMTKVCGACHATGVLNAPKVGDKGDWGKRKAAAGGLDGLVKSAIAGKNAMPPRGGDPSLTDAEIKAAVEQML